MNERSCCGVGRNITLADNLVHGSFGMRIAILIPARYGSVRFPGKALHPLDGQPMAKRVYDQCTLSGFDTFLLSDDERILSLSQMHLKTSQSCRNGTERCAEAADTLTAYDAFINVQGDMPDISVEIIRAVARELQSNSLVTVYTVMNDKERLNPNSVKIIHNTQSAMWCCRAALSYGDHHLGVYGYSRSMLQRYSSFPMCKAELIEGLEQLRWLHAGCRLRVIAVEYSGIEINTPEDAEKWEAQNSSKQGRSSCNQTSTIT